MINQFEEDKEYNLWKRLNQVRNIMYRARDQELSRYGITTTQAAVLRVIKILSETEKKAKPNKISVWLLRKPHTISRILSRMEKDGLVKKHRTQEKGNHINVTLTEKGEQAYEESLKRESIREIISCLSEDERRQLYSSLGKLLQKAVDRSNTIKNVLFPVGYHSK